MQVASKHLQILLTQVENYRKGQELSKNILRTIENCIVAVHSFTKRRLDIPYQKSVLESPTPAPEYYTVYYALEHLEDRLKKLRKIIKQKRGYKFKKFKRFDKLWTGTRMGRFFGRQTLKRRIEFVLEAWAYASRKKKDKVVMFLKFGTYLSKYKK
jgi:hypothetical protein